MWVHLGTCMHMDTAAQSQGFSGAFLNPSDHPVIPGGYRPQQRLHDTSVTDWELHYHKRMSRIEMTGVQVCATWGPHFPFMHLSLAHLSVFIFRYVLNNSSQVSFEDISSIFAFLLFLPFAIFCQFVSWIINNYRMKQGTKLQFLRLNRKLKTR